jgi:hypothetical protein
LNIDSLNEYNNFVVELFSEIFFVRSGRNFRFFGLFWKKLHFSIEAAQFLKAKHKNWLKLVCGKIFELQFLFLKSSKIIIFDGVMDICMNFFIFNWFQSIFEFGLQKLCSFYRKMWLFSKKAKNSKFKIPSRSKKLSW